MGRNLLALAVIGYAFWRGDLLHPSAFYSLWLPLLGLAAFLYLMMRFLLPRQGGRGGDAGGGDSGWSACDADGGSCGGDGGGD